MPNNILMWSDPQSSRIRRHTIQSMACQQSVSTGKRSLVVSSASRSKNHGGSLLHRLTLWAVHPEVSETSDTLDSLNHGGTTGNQHQQHGKRSGYGRDVLSPLDGNHKTVIIEVRTQYDTESQVTFVNSLRQTHPLSRHYVTIHGRKPLVGIRCDAYTFLQMN